MKRVFEITKYTCDRCGRSDEVDELCSTGTLPPGWKILKTNSSYHLCKTCFVNFKKWLRMEEA